MVKICVLRHTFHLREIFVCVKSTRLSFYVSKRSSNGGRYLCFSSVEECVLGNQVCRDVKFLCLFLCFSL